MRIIRKSISVITALNIILLLIFVSGATSRENESKDDLLELLNTEVSTASKYNQKISEIPASVMVITSEDITKYGYTSLADVINSVKSFFIRNDRNYLYAGTRGFERPSSYGNKILLLINGHTYNDNIYQSTNYENELGLDMSIVDRVEIVQGPGSVMYGTGAMLSVINIITKSGRQMNQTKVNFEYGNPGIITSRVSVGYELTDKLNFTLSGNYGKSDGDNLYFPEYDDPTTNNGFANNMDWEKHYGLMGTLNYGDFSLQAYFNSRDKSIPTAAWDMAFNHDSAISTDERAFAELKYEKELSSDINVMLRGYYDTYLYEGKYPYEGDEGNYYYYDMDKGTWLGLEGKIQWDLLVSNRLTFGFEYKNNTEGKIEIWYDEEPDYYKKDFPFTIGSFYLQDNYQITENFSVTGGLRYDLYSIAENSLAPRLAMIYNPFQKSTFKFLYGEAFRVPNLFELYYFDETTLIANPNLKSERNRTHEIIWEEIFGDNIFTSFNVYHYRMFNLIDEDLIVETKTGDTISQFKNLNKVLSYGVEAGITAKFLRAVSGYLYLTYQETKDEEAEKILTNSPAFLAKAGISYEIMEKLFLSYELFYETKRKANDDSFSKSFLLSNLNISYKPKTQVDFINRFELNFKISNLFDTKYSLPGGYEHLQVFIEQYGRRFLFNFSIVM
ncbi:MAG: TonB-dependent receptor [bacterium]